MAKFYVQTDDTLLRLSENFYDVNNNPLSDDGSGSFDIVDDAGNIGLHVDGTGTYSNEFIAGDHVLSNKIDRNEVIDFVAETVNNIDFYDVNNNPLADDGSGSFVVTDESGNIGFKVDSEGVYVKDVIAGDHVLSNKIDTDTVMETLQDYPTKSEVATDLDELRDYVDNIDFYDVNNNPLADDGSGSFVVTDESGNIGFKVDSEGVYVKDVIAGDHVLSNKIDTDTVVEELTKYDTISNVNDKLAELNTTLTNKITTAESNLNTNISNVNTTLTNKINTVESTLSAEITALDQKLSDEIDNVEDSLTNAINNIDFYDVNNNPLSDDGSGSFVVTDESGNIGFKVDSEGVYVKDVIAGDHILSNKIDTDVVFEELTKYDTISNVNDKLAEKVNISSLKNLTIGSKSYNTTSAVTITASDLGLGTALRYIGKTTTSITDGSTTNTIVINSKSVTAQQGDVVIDSSDKKEFVWNGSTWEEFGNEGNYKTKQNAVASPAASGNETAFIDTISQDANGNISVTKKNVDFPQLTGGSAASNDASIVGGVTVSGHAVTVGKKKLVGEGLASVSGNATQISINVNNPDFFETENNPFSYDGQGGFIIADENGNVGFKMTNEDLYVKDVIAGDNVLSNKIDKINPTAQGNVSFGRKDASVIGNNSVVIGYNSEASEENSIAIGSGSTASGKNSTAIGSGSTASGLKSVALGEHNTAAGEYAFATGCYTNSHGVAGSTFGNQATTNSNSWCALSSGIHTVANGLVQHVFGMNNIPDAEVDNYSTRAENLLIIGNGDYLTTPTYQSNAMTLDWSGNAWFAGDVYVGSTSGTNKDAGSKKLLKTGDVYSKSECNNKFIGYTRSTNPDIDKKYDAGIHMISEGTNLPAGYGDNYGVVLTLPYRQINGNTTPDFGCQIFMPNGDDENKPNSMMFRTSLKETWNPWQEVATTGMLPTESTVSGWGFTKNAGTITGIKMNGVSKGTSGVIDLGTVITAHQSLAGYATENYVIEKIAEAELSNSGLTIPEATSNAIGGIKIGYSSSTKNNIPVQLSSGKAYVAVTKDSVTTALGYTPQTTITNNVTYNGTLTSGQVATFDGTSGKIKASGYTINKSVPSNAKFTDTVYAGNYTVQTLSESGKAFTINPNTYYSFTPNAYNVNNVTFSLGAAISGIINEYIVEFNFINSSPNVPTIVFPSTIRWANTITPTFAIGKKYVVSIVNNLAVYAEFNS